MQISLAVNLTLQYFTASFIYKTKLYSDFSIVLFSL